MKFTLFFFVAFLCIVKMFAYPMEDFVDEEDNHEGEHLRLKRATCDLLSFEGKGVKVNHSACAAHCLFLRRRGGYCNSKGVCICRR